MDKHEKIRILVAEDDVFIAESLMLTLQGLGYEINNYCVHPAEALQCLQETNYDLALLDIQFFGNEEGIGLGKTISELYHIPFIFLTAFSDPETVARAAVAGPSAYLVKPASPPALFAAIQTALHNFDNKVVAKDADRSEAKTEFFIKLNSKLYKVDWKEIVSIESSKNYALLRSEDSSLPQIPIRGSVQQVLQLIPYPMAGSFVQINRGCCINIKYITQVCKDYLQVGDEQYVLGESYRKALLEKLHIVK